MANPQQAGKQMKALSRQVLDVVWRNSAGEMSRRRNWSFFVKNVPHDHTLLELAYECFDAMSKDQQRQFLERALRLSAYSSPR